VSGGFCWYCAGIYYIRGIYYILLGLGQDGEGGGGK